MSAIRERLSAMSGAVLLQLQNRLDRILLAWLLFAGLGCAARVALSPLRVPIGIEAILPYVLLIFAPAASIVLALRWFPDAEGQPQPRFRLAVFGRWRDVDRSEARAHPLYGASGIMVSLLVGMLVNIPIRALEYLGAMPAIAGDVPAWLSVLHAMMTLDVVVVSSLYAIAFVAALRHAPLFPRLLLSIWVIDLAMQLFTAELVAGTSGLPAAVADALHDLLGGNVTKALISVALWLPYLLVSKRVNVTYRRRVAR